ncbi:hypothetical protein T265_15893, partial [Opisthorchis viverrini]
MHRKAPHILRCLLEWLGAFLKANMTARFVTLWVRNIRSVPITAQQSKPHPVVNAISIFFSYNCWRI